MWPDSSDGCGAVWLITTEFVIRRTVCVYYYKTVLLLTTSCRLKELRLLSVVILFDSETFLTFPPCEASPSTFTRTVWPPTFNPAHRTRTHAPPTVVRVCRWHGCRSPPPSFMSICQNMLHQRVGFVDPSRWGGWRGRQILMPEAEDTQLLPTEETLNTSGALSLDTFTTDSGNFVTSCY